MKKTIAVVFGGRSAEHDVSIITAHTPIISSLLAAGAFNVVPVYINKDGSWYSDSAMNELSYFTQGDLEEKLKKLAKVRFAFEDGLKLIVPGTIFPKTIPIDVVFPAMHGTFGEDGSLMGLLRMAGVPFVGCDLAASAVAMDKALAKQVVAAEKIPVVPFVWFTKHEWEAGRDARMERMRGLRRPLFVKPVHLGSSIAIAKAGDDERLENAIEVAFHYDDKVLVEESVEHLIEVTLPIMGNENLRFGLIERPLNKTEFFDFNDKYLSGGKKGSGVNSRYSELPADIDAEYAQKVREYGSAAYRALGCSGIARIDFLIDSSARTVYFNEANTLPGSLYHHNWKQAGVSGVELVTTLVALAEERFKRDGELTRTFRSDILNRGRNGNKA